MRCKKLLLLFGAMLMVCAGCSREDVQESEIIAEGNSQGEQAADKRQQAIAGESEMLAEGYRSIYEEAEEGDSLDVLEVKQEIIDYFGGLGYAAVDAENQLDMSCYEQIEKFCSDAEKGKSAEIKIFSIRDGGGFLRYDMAAANGTIDVTVSSLEWEDGTPKTDYFNEYESYTWEYTEKGYLFIEEYHPAGYDGAPGQTAFRVKPLDEKCRELNRRYVLPVGYERNKLLIAEWDEKDISELDLYDLYERFYPLIYGEYVPYKAYEGAEYEVPADEFEEVLAGYVSFAPAEIRENAVYYPDSQTYRYRPRGLHDSELPYGPFPEVVSYKENSDGTFTLTVDAVWEWKKTDRALTSELTVRPLKDGNFHYVSNHVTYCDENLEKLWYDERLSDEEWQLYYGNGEKEQTD